MNCLEWNLSFWGSDKEYRLFYNSEHVIAVKADAVKLINDRDKPYLPLQSYGLFYFLDAFKLAESFRTLLLDYFDFISNKP